MKFLGEKTSEVMMEEFSGIEIWDDLERALRQELKSQNPDVNYRPMDQAIKKSRNKKVANNEKKKNKKSEYVSTGQNDMSNICS